MVDQEFFQQQYLKSMVTTRSYYDRAMARWNRKNEEQLAQLLQAQAERAEQSVEVNYGDQQETLDD